MSSSAAALGRLAFAAIIIGAAPVFGQLAPSTNEDVVVVRPARVPVPGSPQAARNANLPSPPPGPIESRLIPLPEGGRRGSRDAGAAPPAGTSSDRASASPSPGAPMSGAIFANPPVTALAGPDVAAGRPAEPAASAPGTPLTVIGFAGQSANLTDATRAELDRLAKLIAEKGVRRIEVRGYAFGGSIDSRKVALARALVVRAYLIDAKTKARIEVGSFEGEGSHVEILGAR